MRFSWKMVFNDFKEHYPDKWRRGTSYESSDFMSIIVMIPNDGKYKYEYFGKKLTLIEKQLTRNQRKYLKVFEREEAARDIFRLMREKNISQRKLSQLSGISRESINRYHSGFMTPKNSTIDILRKAIESYNSVKE